MIALCCESAGNCVHVMEGHIGIVRCLRLKGDLLVSAGDRKRINIWKVEVCDTKCGVGESERA